VSTTSDPFVNQSFAQVAMPLPGETILRTQIMGWFMAGVKAVTSNILITDNWWTDITLHWGLWLDDQDIGHPGDVDVNADDQEWVQHGFMTLVGLTTDGTATNQRSNAMFQIAPGGMSDSHGKRGPMTAVTPVLYLAWKIEGSSAIWLADGTGDYLGFSGGAIWVNTLVEQAA
jgi:hypothetical protein